MGRALSEKHDSYEFLGRSACPRRTGNTGIPTTNVQRNRSKTAQSTSIGQKVHPRRKGRSACRLQRVLNKSTSILYHKYSGNSLHRNSGVCGGTKKFICFLSTSSQGRNGAPTGHHAPPPAPLGVTPLCFPLELVKLGPQALVSSARTPDERADNTVAAVRQPPRLLASRGLNFSTLQASGELQQTSRYVTDSR